MKQNKGPDWFYGKFHSKRFNCIDHIRKTTKGFRIHPYSADPKELYDFSVLAKLNGYDMTISGGSEYSNNCLVIELIKEEFKDW